MKKFIVPIIVVLIILSLVGIIYKNRFSRKQEIVLVPTPTVMLPTISDDVQVDLTATRDKHAIILKISNIPQGIESIEYELTYITASDLPRGVLGKITLQGESEIVRDDIVLGTCSSGKCVYDEGVTTVDLSLKFNSPGGAKVFHKSYDL